MGNLLLFIISMGWMGMDQLKHDREVKRRKEERERNRGEKRFFWQ